MMASFFAGARPSELLLLALPLLLLASALFQCSADSTMKTYLVHVKENLKSATEKRDWHLALIANATAITSEAALQQRLLYSYSFAFQGFAALLTPSEAAALGALEDDVVALSEASVSELHTTRTPSFLKLLSDSTVDNGASGPLWSASARGDSIIIGVIDTGVWPEHPSFSDAGLAPLTAANYNWNGSCDPLFPCNNKIIGARHFSAGYVADVGHPINESLEFDSPRDSDGHGTHTASTAAGSPVLDASFFGLASGTASGIAPLARLSIYKACWSTGCYDVDIIAAFEAAINDGVHVISVSLGGHRSTIYSSDGIALGSFAAVARGIMVVCSAGNDGPALGSVTNGPPWILTVAASSLDRDFPATITLGNGSIYVGSSLYVGLGIGSGPELRPLIHAKDAAVVAEADAVEKAGMCLDASYLDPALVNGKVVFCEAGNVSTVTKGLAVGKAGGVAMIVASFIDEKAELVAAAYLTPAAQVGYEEGEAIKQYIDRSSTPTARIDFNGTRLKGGRAPSMAAFSSRGPHLTSMDIAKPDISGPGLNILAAWPDIVSPSGNPEDERRKVSFNIISGTSMACPHVAGLAALLKAAHPTWSPAAIRSALMTTATIVDNTNETMVDLGNLEPASVLNYGSGHVQPNLALDPGLVYDIQPQAYVDFLCAYYPSGSLIREYGTTSTSCTSPLPSMGDLNYPSFSVVFYQSSETSESLSATFHRTVTNVGSNPNSTYRVSVIPPRYVNVSISPSTLSFDTHSQTLTYSITFSAPRSSSSNLLVAFGRLFWSDSENHVVGSPISVYWFP